MAKSEKIELIYSRQSTDFAQGKTYANPRFFSTPRRNVVKVYLVGNWPKIEQAYKSIGVPVEHLDEVSGEAVLPIDGPAPTSTKPPPPVKKPEAHPQVEIPSDWRDLPWSGTPSVRGLAMQLSEEPVLNKAQAVAIISAELARRGQSSDDEGVA